MSHQSADLQNISRQIRKDIIQMTHAAKSGHPGGSLSAVEILTTLYFDEMNIDPSEPKRASRDLFVLSKGHAAPVLYAALARRGYFDPAELLTLRQLGSRLQGHPDMKNIPGVEMSTGSLGQGFSTAVGMAVAARVMGNSRRVYALLGDGELNEGLIWEAAMSGAHYKLSNLTAILDFNGLQIDGTNDEVMSVSPVDQKFRSFGWNVIMAEGHDFDDLKRAFKEARACSSAPSVILAKTVKGKGVSFMEDQVGWHGKAPSAEEMARAIEELGGAEHV
ncbi:transketolase [Acidaminobacter hydrogenoformans]|uniref:Transketolase n=1 Tax=Acidaminobacter hydrogenoformans DSM 2784 TaxID=1120920 RepID=A0A1G5S5F8_9FIRM|nr:transketolase [Acidaminobacter hydrogenoformans]SCZ80779.1 transketolase [Acidaminobacter hydrogenoformans DSM 2784]